MTERQSLIELLEECAKRVRSIEKEAEAAIQGRRDQEGYESHMREKALLLAGLRERAAPLLKGGDETVTERVKRFSASAEASLNIGSVFYMSALLYPEDHRPGDPNDLEVFVETLKSG